MSQISIQKLVFGGQGLGRLEKTTDEKQAGKVVFAFNALPGEDIEFETIKGTKAYLEGIATKIIKPSPDRIEPREAHFLSCSPWQILTFAKENEWKQEIAVEAYFKLKNLPANIEITSDEDNQYGYRNKMEFSFMELKNGQMSLAFFQRGQRHKVQITGCNLAEAGINETAQNILDWINLQKIPLRSLKSLIVRSNGAGQTIAALFIKDELNFDSYPNISNPRAFLCHPRVGGDLKGLLPNSRDSRLRGNDSQCLGFQLYYSTHKSPASVPTKLLYSVGADFLVAQLKNTQLKFGLLSFFQVNINLFDQALNDISKFLDPQKSVIDYYAGVGAIGLSLSPNCKDITLVESNAEAVNYAQENIKLNNIQNAVAELTPAEKMLDLIDSEKIIIFDPPRAGIHDKLITKILAKKPVRLIYLSCNLTTQARDIEFLQNDYDLKFLKLYNFFPRTPHIEGLAVLDRKIN